MNRTGYGAWLRFLLSIPGRLSVWLSRTPVELPPSQLDLSATEQLIRNSPRGNNYLAMEPEITGFGDHQGWLGYATLGTTLLSAGGVHGEEPASVLRTWKERACQSGYKRLLLFPVLSHERKTYQTLGFKSLHVGSEAIISIPEFTLEGRTKRNLRQTIHRANRNKTLSLEETKEHSIPKLKALFEKWLGSRIRDFRMRVLVGSPGFDTPLGRRFFTCYHNGEPVAFITITPGWNGKGWGMDIMARAPQAPPGAMEWLISGTIELLGKEGAELFSLGACPMRLTEPRISGESRLLRFIFRGLYQGALGGRLFRFRELARFKEKFSPTWIPIYFGGYPKVSIRALYDGCRMWGLFDEVDLKQGEFTLETRN